MPAVRRKAPRQQAPQTIAEATDLLGRYAGIVTEIERIRADADASIAAIEAARDSFAAPLEQAAKDLFLQLRAWWAVAGAELTEGKRKSYELAGCILGERTTTPKVGHGKAKVADIIAQLLDDPRLEQLVRIKEELDKPAILKAFGDETLREALTEIGLKITQKEEFFIDRAAPKPANPEEVILLEAAE